MISMNESELIREWVDIFTVHPVPANKFKDTPRCLLFSFHTKSDPAFAYSKEEVRGDKRGFIKQIQNSIVSNWNGSKKVLMAASFMKDRVTTVIDKICEERFNARKPMTYGIFYWNDSENSGYYLAEIEWDNAIEEKVIKTTTLVFPTSEFDALPEMDEEVALITSFIASYPEGGNGDFFMTFGGMEEGIAISPILDGKVDVSGMSFIEFEDMDSLDKKFAIIKGSTNCFINLAADSLGECIMAKPFVLAYMRNLKESLTRALVHYAVIAKDFLTSEKPYILGNVAVKTNGTAILFPSCVSQCPFPAFVDSEKHDTIKFDSKSWAIRVFGDDVIV